VKVNELKKHLNLFSILLLVLAVMNFSCEKHSAPENKGSSTDQEKIDEESIRNQGMKDPQTSDAFKPEELQSYLPDVIKSYRGLPASTGTGFREGYSWTQVTRSYTIPTGDLRITITDYADIGDFIQPKIQQINKPLAEEGETTRQISGLKDAISYEAWNLSKKSGRLEALVAKRFYIEIIATNLPAEFSGLEEVLKAINLELLAKFPAKK